MASPVWPDGSSKIARTLSDTYAMHSYGVVHPAPKHCEEYPTARCERYHQIPGLYDLVLQVTVLRNIRENLQIIVDSAVGKWFEGAQPSDKCCDVDMFK